MIRKSSRVRLIFAAALIASIGAACGSNDNEDIQQGDEGFPPLSPDVIYAEGWKDVTIEANSAKTILDTMGHYTTDRNMCQRRGDGAYELDPWNKLSQSLNEAVKSAPLTTPRCAPSPNESKFYSPGIVVVQLENAEKRQIFELKNGDICTTIADQALANTIMAQVEEAIKLADQADAMDCPGYRPPGST